MSQIWMQKKCPHIQKTSKRKIEVVEYEQHGTIELLSLSQLTLQLECVEKV